MKNLLYLILIIPIFLFGFNPTSTYASSPNEVDLNERSQPEEFPTEYKKILGTDVDVLLGQEISVLVDENTGEITEVENDISSKAPRCATCNQYTWKTATDVRQSRVYNKLITETTTYSFNLKYNINIKDKVSIGGGGEKIYSSTKKWDQYKESWKMTGVLKTYNYLGQLILTENRTENYTKYVKVATK